MSRATACDADLPGVARGLAPLNAAEAAVLAGTLTDAGVMLLDVS